MSHHRQTSPLLKARARELRQHSTAAELRLWRYLRRHNLGAKFRRQVPLGGYIVDFLSFHPKIVIEVDGGQHAESLVDRDRDSYFRRRGFIVLRFWNSDVMANLEGILETIARTLAEGPE